jgi:hypothetical protein
LKKNHGGKHYQKEASQQQNFVAIDNVDLLNCQNPPRENPHSVETKPPRGTAIPKTLNSKTPADVGPSRYGTPYKKRKTADPT